MIRFLGALVAATAIAASAAAAEEVIVIDAPDVQKLESADRGFRTSEVIGTDVYGNAGKRIGEVEDFTVNGGYLYAVIDIQDGPIEQYVELADDDMIVVPWDQLRVQDRPEG